MVKLKTSTQTKPPKDDHIVLYADLVVHSQNKDKEDPPQPAKDEKPPGIVTPIQTSLVCFTALVSSQLFLPK